MADEALTELAEEEEDYEEEVEEEEEGTDSVLTDEFGEEAGSQDDEEQGEEKGQEVEVEAKVLTLEQAKERLGQLGRTASGLQHAYLMVDLSDMGLTDISVLPAFRYLLFVNVSGNMLSDDELQVLSTMAHLLSIQADRNRLTKPYLPPMSYLQVLTLNTNKISSTRGIAHPILECLELNHNQISEIDGLDPAELPRLRVLELRGNSLSSTYGIPLQSLESLYLAGNSVDRLEGLAGLRNLRALHLRDNPLATLDGFHADMSSLRYVNVRSCRVSSARETSKLAVLPRLEVLVVAGNPFAVQEDEDGEGEGEDYRLKVLAFLPRLKRLDKVVVSEEELEQAREMFSEMEESGQA